MWGLTLYLTYFVDYLRGRKNKIFCRVCGLKLKSENDLDTPYKMNYDLAGGENKTFTFKADTVGGFTYYCIYDLPSMIGHLEVLP